MSAEQYASFDHPWIDNSRAPMYMLTAPEVFSDEDLQHLLAAQLDVIRTIDHPYALVAIFHKVLSMSAKQRAMWAAAEKEIAPFEREWSAGQAMVVRSAFARGVIRAVQWLSPPAYPTLVTESTVDAVVWAKQRLAERGIELAPQTKAG